MRNGMISTTEIRRVIDEGEIIEDYPQDPRGHSSLVLGRGAAGRPLHVLCAVKDEYLVIITAYLPDEDEWANDYRVRKQP